MDVFELIARAAGQAPVVLFMKGSPQRPTSADSKAAVEILQQCEADFAWVDVQTDPVMRAFLPKFSASAQCPQLFMQGELIGGVAVIGELYDQGELCQMIAQCRHPMAQAS